MNQEGFTNIALIVLVLVLAGIAGYFALVRKPIPVSQQTSAPTQTPTVTQKPTTEQPALIQQDETADWKVCKNTKYGYEVKYPPTWKVLKPGAPEARLANCEENLAIITFSPNLFEYQRDLIQQINVGVSDPERLRGTIYEGSNSIDNYFAKNPAILQNSPKIKETTLDGERLIWLKGRWLLAFHDDSVFEFRISSAVDDKTLDQFLGAFRFR